MESPPHPERVQKSLYSLRGANVLRDADRVWTVSAPRLVLILFANEKFQPRDHLTDGTFNAVITLSLLQMAADAYQSSRDKYDQLDRTHACSPPVSDKNGFVAL